MVISKKCARGKFKFLDMATTTEAAISETLNVVIIEALSTIKSTKRTEPRATTPIVNKGTPLT